MSEKYSGANLLARNAGSAIFKTQKTKSTQNEANRWRYYSLSLVFVTFKNQTKIFQPSEDT